MAAVRPARRPFALSWQTRSIALLVLVYAVYAAAQLDVSPARVRAGLDHAGTFLARMFPPNFEKPDTLIKGIVESLEIAVLASVPLVLGFLGAVH
ncbi:MAG: phosphonate ABC transporter, permease protein PhnE, partial [Bordetella sp.]|nr:phosphonate ABC transporter, permease protein PhnE [Bordetella sp.]